MIPPNLLARLAGAQPDVLRKAKTDRVKYTAMGGVLLTTAGVAGVSAAFALATAVGLPVAAAVIAGILWAVVIFNLDRMLIVSMTRQAGWLRNLLSLVPRLALAFVIGSVISVPLVLQIFHSEIDSELQRIHVENTQADQAALDKAFADTKALQAQVVDLQAVAAGTKQPSVNADPDVVAAQKKVDDAQAAFDAADKDAQCELNGSCGTGKQGVGVAYRQAKQRRDLAETTLAAATAQLNEVTTAAQARITGGAGTARADAAAQLTTLVPELEKQQADEAQLRARQTDAEGKNEGLLARLGALDRLSADSASMRSANLALFLLFLLIEVLPVMVKLLSMVGKPTLYDRLLETEEANLTTRATHQDDVALQIDQHRVAEQIRQGKEANTLLVDMQGEIAKKAIAVWGQIAMSRSDAELARWYAQYSGGQLPPSSGTAPAHPLPQQPTSNSVHPSSTAPTAPLSVPTPRAAGGQSYQQFKAVAGVPATNGHQPGTTI